MVDIIAKLAAGVSVALAIFALATPAQAQNGYSFIDAAKSPINYSIANARPQIGCADLRSLSDAETAIIDARIVPAADGVPEHCRITGNILPEVAFEVNLPCRGTGASI
jgi:hypothetical protein